MTFESMIFSAEESYQKAIFDIANAVCQNRSIRLILVAGPSCSGKTTTSALLQKYLFEIGNLTAHTISIDDFYKDVTYLPGETVNDKDFESLDSIDLDLLHLTLRDLAIGKQVDIPLFDFEKTYRNGIRSTVKLCENDIAIIEGLHALNPEIYENFVDENKIIKVFLDCHDEDDGNKHERLVRRLVRDRNFRAADAHLTFTLWQKVLIGEQKYIYPFASNATFSVNTYHEYEPYLLRQYADILLDEIGEDSVFYADAISVKKYLRGFDETISKDDIPKNSLLREFVG